MKTTGKIMGTLVLIAVLTVQVMATEYKVDKSKSKVEWNGKKVTGEHHGTLELKSGKLEVDGTRVTSGKFVMDMTSIKNEDLSNESMNQKLVGHLKSDDFFAVDKHPTSTLELNDVVLKTGNEYTFMGNLTIKDITHPVTFDATMDVKNGKLEANGEIEVDRTLYDIKFRSGRFFSDLGDNLIYDTFTLDFDIVANEASKATTETN